MTESLRRIVLRHHPVGIPRVDDFRLDEAPLPELKSGQALVKLDAVSVDPGTRSRLSPGASYARPLALGEPIDGFGVGRVVQTKTDAVAIGQTVALGASWSSHAVLSPRGYWQVVDTALAPLTSWIGVLGIPGMTAWFGLTRIARLQPGERVLISSAAGPVGMTAAAIARQLGAAQVVGTAGGTIKCGECLASGLFDEMVDYRSGSDFQTQLAAALPDGADVVFDNVGASFLNFAVPLMRSNGRVVISGQVADYNQTEGDLAGFTGLRWLIAKRLSLQGIVVFDDRAGFEVAQRSLAGLLAEKKLPSREVLFRGLESAPEAFVGLFQEGSVAGRRIVVL